MASTAYTFLDNVVPKDAVDLIARVVHVDQFRGGLKDAIEDYCGAFERSCLSGAAFTEVMSDVEVAGVELEYEWITVVLNLGDNRFVAFHEYFENNHVTHMLMEVEAADGELRVLRFYHKHGSGKVDTEFDEDWYTASSIGFGFVADTVAPDAKFVSRLVGKWQKPEQVVSWFNATEWYTGDDE